MLNLVQLQERLKDLPMQAVMQYANGMNPQVPPFLALGELNRRKKMQENAAAEQAKEMAGAPSVKEQIEQQAGLMALQGARQRQAAQQQAGIQAAMPMAAPNTMTSEPAQMAGGGAVNDVMGRDYRYGGLASMAQPGQGMDPEMMKKLLMLVAARQKGGLGGLPMRDDMFKREDYAGGGIVAFKEGGQSAADVITGALDEQETADEFEGMELSPLQKLIIKKMKERQAQPGILERRRAFGLSDEAPDATARTRAELDRREKEFEASDTFTDRLLALKPGRFGSGSLGRSVGEYEKGRQAQMNELRKLRAAAEDQREAAKIAYKEGRFADAEKDMAEARKLDMEAIKSVAETGRTEAQTAQAISGRTTDWARRYNAYLPEVMQQLGIDDENDPRVKAVTARKVDESIGLTREKLNIQGQQAATAASREATQDYEAAAKIVDPMIGYGGARRQEYRNILKKEGKEAAAKFREGLIQEELRRMRGQGTGGKSASGPVKVTAPNGQTFTFPNQEAADRFKASINAQ